MRGEHRNRFSRLDEQGLIWFKLLEGVQNRFKAGPIAGSFANASIHHKVFRSLRDFRIQVVLDHPVGSLNQPILAGEFIASGSTHCPRLCVRDVGRHAQILAQMTRDQLVFLWSRMRSQGV